MIFRGGGGNFFNKFLLEKNHLRVNNGFWDLEGEEYFFHNLNTYKIN